MKQLVLVLSLAAVMLAGSQEAFAQSKPVLKLGFKTLASQIPDIAGEPLEEEHWGANGDSLQRTTTGLMVWRKADNWTAFTNGSRTWINGPDGVQDRGNDERFTWESDRSPRPSPTASNTSTAPTTPSESGASARVSPSVVLLKTQDGAGSGFAVGGQMVLTNKHVVGKATTLSVQTSDGRQLQGDVAARSSVLDMALVRVPGLDLSSTEFADLTKMRAGDSVLAVGHALGLGGNPTVTRGVYSAVRVLGGDITGEWVQTDAAINPGNSGGPLVNLNGEIVGMVTWGINKLPDGTSVEGIKFALGANSLRDNLPALLLAAGEMPVGAVPAAPAVAQEVEAFLKRYDTAQSLSAATSDPSPLKDLESPVLHARTTSIMDEQRKDGIRAVSRLVSFQLRSAYALPDDVVAADVVERWSSKYYRGDTLVKDRGETDEPQIAIVKRTPSGWQLLATQWLEVRSVGAPTGSTPGGSAQTPPSSDWQPGPDAAMGFPIIGVIDVPKEGDTARGRLRIAGWVVDPRAEGQPWNGIDDVRVLVGVSQSGGSRLDSPGKLNHRERPDVAAALGKAPYAKSGFDIDVEPPVGRHTITVLVHSTVSGWWYKNITITIHEPPPPPNTSLKGESWFSYPYDGSAIYQGIITNLDTRFKVTELEVTVRVYGSGSRLLAEGRATVANRTVRPGEQTTWQYYISPNMAQQTVYCEYSYRWNWSAS